MAGDPARRRCPACGQRLDNPSRSCSELQSVSVHISVPLCPQCASLYSRDSTRHQYVSMLDLPAELCQKHRQHQRQVLPCENLPDNHDAVLISPRSSDQVLSSSSDLSVQEETSPQQEQTQPETSEPERIPILKDLVKQTPEVFKAARFVEELDASSLPNEQLPQQVPFVLLMHTQAAQTDSWRGPLGAFSCPESEQSTSWTQTDNDDLLLIKGVFVTGNTASPDNETCPFKERTSLERQLTSLSVQTDPVNFLPSKEDIEIYSVAIQTDGKDGEGNRDFEKLDPLLPAEQYLLTTNTPSESEGLFEEQPDEEITFNDIEQTAYIEPNQKENLAQSVRQNLYWEPNRKESDSQSGREAPEIETKTNSVPQSTSWTQTEGDVLLLIKEVLVSRNTAFPDNEYLPECLLLKERRTSLERQLTSLSTQTDPVDFLPSQDTREIHSVTTQTDGEDGEANTPFPDEEYILTSKTLPEYDGVFKQQSDDNIRTFFDTENPSKHSLVENKRPSLQRQVTTLSTQTDPGERELNMEDSVPQSGRETPEIEINQEESIPQSNLKTPGIECNQDERVPQSGNQTPDIRQPSAAEWEDPMAAYLCTLMETPLSTPDHNDMEEIDESLASLKSVMESPWCPAHENKFLELYCMGHQLPICLLCASTTHRTCQQLRALKNILRERSKEIEGVVRTLKDKETALAQQRKCVEDTLEELHEMSNPVPDSYEQNPEKREEWSSDPRHRKTIMTPPRPAKKTRSSLADRRLSNSCNKNSPAARVLPQITQTSHSPVRSTRGEPQTSPLILPLLQASYPSATSSEQIPVTGGSSTVWIGLSATPGVVCTVVPPPYHLSLSSTAAEKTREDGISFSPCAYKPYGPELARILRVGDRVKRSEHWMMNGESGRSSGTVTAIPSIRLDLEQDPTGLVDVLWDSGGEGSYRMGRYNHYDLELA